MNVVLLMSDEHNPFFSSCYGHPLIQTPQMSAMAAEGTLFRNAYCPSPLCHPSRSAFLTGHRVHELQTYSNCNVNLDGRAPTYGAELSKQGVYTAYIGKTDIHAPSHQLGFDEMMLAGDRKQPGDTNFVRRPLNIREDADQRSGKFGPKDGAYAKDLRCIDTAVSWIQTKGTQLEQPWVLTVNITSPHFPTYTTQELWDRYPQGEDLSPYDGDSWESSRHPYAMDLKAHFKTALFPEAHKRGIRRGYLACITFVDQQIGRLREAIALNGLAASTDFIYTSDHGDMMGKFGMWWKCSLYEDSVRIPCLAVGPSFGPGGQVVDTPVDLLDVQAALFKAAGATQPPDRKGTALQDIMPNDPERMIFAEYHGHGTRSGAYMVRKGDWKLIWYAEAPHQLFHLASDPDELTNVYSQQLEKAQELEAELRAICDPEAENERAHLFQEEQRRILESQGIHV
ncbi:sulfatase-like hydrolase/transferase [Paenibacillus cremeus]|uniref:Sulfatase-like hydrolase/transferase n=1 Tax=Paenibacillus cremeus TaxID=2163881 RepID=A0A559K7N9_9BACL|nr:sulfatase-like hydrolase/transferase [Paenibacillus cremeus]TVY08142.1 sulfatase-like hydrolase/transferase [Paenibacillus cremeus]